ncbi:MAG: DUF192 domain-containing protein [Proteobacteria bacterium]|jgi:uncharacterized membrane protein (UPF0127 family)|nr:MAG: DUF192 domain-containing protein [Pseudomonadota bacterium]
MKNFTMLNAAVGLTCLMALYAHAEEKFPVVPLTAGMHVIQAEVAATGPQREKGLMFREKLGTNAGMVFVFGEPAQVCMWMKNTPLPLSVAFLDAQGKILNIEDMQPQTLDSHCAKGPAAYALEMNKGWFAQKNIKPGTAITGLPRVK